MSNVFSNSRQEVTVDKITVDVYEADIFSVQRTKTHIGDRSGTC